jgi:hypothetical protein
MFSFTQGRVIIDSLRYGNWRTILCKYAGEQVRGKSRVYLAGKHHALKEYRGSGDEDPCTLNPVSRWK